MNFTYGTLSALSAVPTPSALSGLVAELGGTAAGLAILCKIAENSEGLSTPPVLLVQPNEDDPASVASVDSGTTDSREQVLLYGHSWAIKYSGSRESFSGYSRRGQHSSSGRRIETGMSADAIARSLRQVWQSRPPGTTLIALQRFLDLTQPHAVVDINVQNGFAWLELIQELSRMLAVSDMNGALLYREVAGTDPPGISDQEVDFITRCALEIHSSAGEVIPRLNIEAMFFPKGPRLELLQLRPTPPDRPCDNLGFTAPSPHEPADLIWSTRFVRGSFELTIENLAPKGSATRVFIRGDTGRSRHDAELLFSTIDEDGLVLVDTVTGFRMTHEQWNLPPADKREHYNFLYLPQSILDYSKNARLHISCNGDIAVGWLE
jgi:hypothetical protein